MSDIKTTENKIICSKCNVPLALEKTKFQYLGHEFNSDVPRCPVCGQVYLTEKLVTGRIASVESGVEDK